MCERMTDKSRAPGAAEIAEHIGAESLARLRTLENALESRYPCGENGGGWIHYTITADADLDDVIKFIEIRKKPVR